MTKSDPTIDETFREYADLQILRHQLLSDKKDDSQEIVAAEERMEELWEKLDAVQQHALSGMGSDLNWIRRNFQPPPKGRQTASDVLATDRQELAAAMKSKDWHRILHYLRLCAPSFRASSVARERGIAYAAIGLRNYARVFDALTLQFDPRTASFEAGAGKAVDFSEMTE